ncbi:unnamed protein product [Spirodela intermedia]|uniref:Uncharacterized protein n=1 Tax=Spirodela intermedia TaxID=51605 RepID=A0A7I8IW34_SPIIN|nr:unnamed protein product [Spirodela intermedia]CAA6662019.1 unnamed protein product [Spirodela intermedia]
MYNWMIVASYHHRIINKIYDCDVKFFYQKCHQFWSNS